MTAPLRIEAERIVAHTTNGHLVALDNTQNKDQEEQKEKPSLYPNTRILAPQLNHLAGFYIERYLDVLEATTPITFMEVSLKSAEETAQRYESDLLIARFTQTRGRRNLHIQILTGDEITLMNTNGKNGLDTHLQGLTVLDSLLGPRVNNHTAVKLVDMNLTRVREGEEAFRVAHRAFIMRQIP